MRSVSRRTRTRRGSDRPKPHAAQDKRGACTSRVHRASTHRKQRGSKRRAHAPLLVGFDANVLQPDARRVGAATGGHQDLVKGARRFAIGRGVCHLQRAIGVLLDLLRRAAAVDVDAAAIILGHDLVAHLHPGTMSGAHTRSPTITASCRGTAGLHVAATGGDAVDGSDADLAAGIGARLACGCECMCLWQQVVVLLRRDGSSHNTRHIRAALPRPLHAGFWRCVQCVVRGIPSFMFAVASKCMISMQAQLVQLTRTRGGTHLLIKALEDLVRSDEKLHVSPCRTTDPFCTTMTMNNPLSVVSPSRAIAQIHCLLISVLCQGCCDGFKARATHECRWHLPYESRYQQTYFIHRGDLWARYYLM